MKAVGLRELKNRLSEYVRDVRAGEGILVTDRGQVVAELNPPGHGAAALDVTPGLAALVRKGLIEPGASNEAARYPRLPRALRRARAADLLDAERGGR
jgi:antitoxin (DNA-binding transcriptional repressor) of toxin-antitoxin stability system